MALSTLNLTPEWDKTFPKSELVNHSKVTFHNRYGIELAADMYVPKNTEGRFPAIAVSGPFGAVKEQSSGLYAQHMAERGFLTIAFDPSYTGESGGEPRRMASPDINTEDFLAAWSTRFRTTPPGSSRGLSCLLQDAARLSRAQRQLQRRLERHRLPEFPEPAPAGLGRRD